jgi:hypothetical protein
MWQLEEALHRPALSGANGGAPAVGEGLGPRALALPPGSLPAGALAAAAMMPSWRRGGEGGSAAAANAAVQELLRLPTPRPAPPAPLPAAAEPPALPAATTSAVPAAGTTVQAPGAGEALWAAAGAQRSSPGDSTWTADAAVVPASPAPSYSIRQPPSSALARTRRPAATTIDVPPEEPAAGPRPVGGEASPARSASLAARPAPGPSTNLASALAGLLAAASRLAAVSGVLFIASAPLGAGLAPRPRAAGGGAAHGESGEPGSAAEHGEPERGRPAPSLIPRPSRPLLVAVPAVLVQRLLSYVLDIVLDSTPKGGQVCISAAQDGTGVQLVVLHTGRLEPRRLHLRHISIPGAGQPAAASGPVAPVHGSPPAASGVLSLEMAQELAAACGGQLHVRWPTHLVHAGTGSLDVGTSVEVWLPSAAA